MSVAYVDSSVVVAIALGERGSEAVAKRLTSFTQLHSSNLLDAELRAALARENAPYSSQHVEHIRWLWPSRPLGPEMERALAAGYLRGADLWHVAAALFAAPVPREMAFVTLDERQRAVAAELGFRV